MSLTFKPCIKPDGWKWIHFFNLTAKFWHSNSNEICETQSEYWLFTCLPFTNMINVVLNLHNEMKPVML